MRATTQASSTSPRAQKLGPRQSGLQRLVSDVLYVAKRDRRFWVLPLIILLVALAGLLILAAAAGPLAPFIYPLL